MMNPGVVLGKLVYWVTMTVSAFLGLRFILRLFGANPQADFVNWIYENTAPLLNPFAGVFASARLEGGYTIEFSTLFAIIIYILVGFLITTLVDAVTPVTAGKVTKRRK